MDKHEIPTGIHLSLKINKNSTYPLNFPLVGLTNKTMNALEETLFKNVSPVSMKAGWIGNTADQAWAGPSVVIEARDLINHATSCYKCILSEWAL